MMMYRVWYRGNGDNAMANEALFTEKEAAEKFAKENNGTLNMWKWKVEIED